MQDQNEAGLAIGDLEAQYDAHLLNVRGLPRSTRNLHRLVTHKLLSSCFSSGQISWHDFHFRDVVGFVTSEFRRLRSRETQRAWLMVLRSLLRYLAEERCIARGWDAALPSITSWSTRGCRVG
jgi:hypothetical protein